MTERNGYQGYGKPGQLRKGLFDGLPVVSYFFVSKFVSLTGVALMADSYGRDTSNAGRKPRRLLLERLEDRLTPTVLAPNDFYEVEVGKVLTVNFDNGVLINDLSTTNRGNALFAEQQTNPAYITAGGIVLPPDALSFRSDGSFTFFTPSDAPAGQVTFQYKAVDPVGPPIDDSAIGTVTITIRDNPTRLFAVVPDVGGGAIVRAFDAKTGLERFTVQPFEASYRGGLTVATGDLNNDGTDDVVVGAGEGGGPVVVLYDGASGGEITRFFALGDPNFRGGVNVAVGDVDGGGTFDIIVGAGTGGGPLVNVLLSEQGKSFAFFAYDQNFRGGVRVASGDLRNTGRDAVITGPGLGGGPNVRAFDLVGLRRIADFMAYDPDTRAGVFVASGNFGKDYDDIVTGAGAGDPIVNIFDGKSQALQRSFTAIPQDQPTGDVLLGGPVADTLDFFGPSGSLLPNAQVPASLTPSVTAIAGSQPGASQGRFATAAGGVRVAVVDRDRDRIADIVTGNGSGSSPRVRVFDGETLTEVQNILAFDPNFLGGIMVGGGPEPDTDFGP